MSENDKKNIEEVNKADQSMDEMGVIIVKKWAPYADRPTKIEQVLKITRRQYLARKYEGELVSKWISIKKVKTPEQLLNDNDPDLDEPFICMETVGYEEGSAYHPKPIIGPVAHTKREVNANNGLYGLAGRGGYHFLSEVDFLSEVGRAPKNEEEKELVRRLKEKIEKIKNSDDPKLDKRGLVKIGATDKMVETTLRKAMLCSRNLDPKDIGFKTYEEIIKELQEEIVAKKARIAEQEATIAGLRQEIENKEEGKNSRITWKGIKSAISGRNEREEK